MQEAINQKFDQLRGKGSQVCMSVSRLTSRNLMRGMRKLLALLKRQVKNPRGVQTVKSLIRQGQGVSAIELDMIKDFNKTARKYGVDYAVRKNDQEKYLIFFKAKDADALTACFKEYTHKRIRAEEKTRESVHSQLRKAKERMKEVGRTLDKTRAKAVPAR